MVIVGKNWFAEICCILKHVKFEAVDLVYCSLVPMGHFTVCVCMLSFC